MTRLDGDPTTTPVQTRVTFGVSKLWVPHVALICYVLLSPQHYADQSAVWVLGTYVRVLVGRRVVNTGAAFMWAVHLFEAGYTVILARRYKTTQAVWVRSIWHSLSTNRTKS